MSFFFWLVLWLGTYVEVDVNRLTISPPPSLFIFLLPTILCLTQVTKDFEKTTKYSQLRLELTNRYPEYKVNEYNLIMDVVGGCSKEVEQTVKELVGDKCE